MPTKNAANFGATVGSGLTHDFPSAAGTLNNQLRVISLATDAPPNTTITAAKITALDLVADVGLYEFKYLIRYQSGATTTGVKFSVNHTGTLTFIVGNMRYVDAAATASGGAHSQTQNASTAGVMGSYSFRDKSALANIGPTLSVNTANADMLIIIEGIMDVSAVGSIELYHASEVAASSTVKLGTCLKLIKNG